MARQLRLEYPGAFYHVMNRGAGRKNIFHTEKHYYLFLELLAELKHNFDVEIHAYCLMSNHYHLLIKTPHSNLSKAMKHLNSVYTMRYNRLLKQDGPLFRGRFKSILIDADSYLLQVSRYIHLNPIEANLTQKPESYPWSSYQYYIKKHPAPIWLTSDEILSQFSTKKNSLNYRSFMLAGIDPETYNIYKSGKNPAIFGKESFCKKIKEKLKIKPNIEIPETKKMPNQFVSKEKIVEEIAKYKKYNANDILNGKDKALKKIAIYFCKRLTNDSLTDIGSYFCNISYSGISQIYKRIKIEMNENKKLAREISEIEAILSNVKT